MHGLPTAGRALAQHLYGMRRAADILRLGVQGISIGAGMEADVIAGGAASATGYSELHLYMSVSTYIP